MGNELLHLNKDLKDLTLVVATLELLLSQQEEHDVLLEELLDQLWHDAKLDHNCQTRSTVRKEGRKRDRRSPKSHNHC